MTKYMVFIGSADTQAVAIYNAASSANRYLEDHPDSSPIREHILTNNFSGYWSATVTLVLYTPSDEELSAFAALDALSHYGI